MHLEPEEIFINDGAKGDLGNLGDILSGDDVIAVCDPTYPAYVDSNVVYGRCGEYDAKKGQWSRVIYLPCVKENGFVPELPAERPDVLYLCFPNNPTGAAITRAQLQRFVDYALENGCLIVYDAAYEGFIESPDVPHTVYECAGAKRCAIEVRSFSKTAGFTGCRLGYMAIPMELEADGVKLNALWRQRLAVKSNGVPYVIQRGGEAAYSRRAARKRARRSPTTRKTPPPSATGCGRRAMKPSAARTPRMSGCARRAGGAHGNSLTCCWSGPTSWERPAPALAPAERGTSA